MIWDLSLSLSLYLSSLPLLYYVKECLHKEYAKIFTSHDTAFDNLIGVNNLTLIITIIPTFKRYRISLDNTLFVFTIQDFWNTFFLDYNWHVNFLNIREYSGITVFILYFPRKIKLDFLVQENILCIHDEKKLVLEDESHLLLNLYEN